MKIYNKCIYIMILFIAYSCNNNNNTLLEEFDKKHSSINKSDGVISFIRLWDYDNEKLYLYSIKSGLVDSIEIEDKIIKTLIITEDKSKLFYLKEKFLFKNLETEKEEIVFFDLKKRGKSIIKLDKKVIQEQYHFVYNKYDNNLYISFKNKIMRCNFNEKKLELFKEYPAPFKIISFLFLDKNIIALSINKQNDFSMCLDNLEKDTLKYYPLDNKETSNLIFNDWNENKKEMTCYNIGKTFILNLNLPNFKFTKLNTKSSTYYNPKFINDTLIIMNGYEMKDRSVGMYIYNTNNKEIKNILKIDKAIFSINVIK